MSHPGPFGPQQNESGEPGGPGASAGPVAPEAAEHYEVYVPGIEPYAADPHTTSATGFYPPSTQQPWQMSTRVDPQQQAPQRRTGWWWGLGSLGVVALILTVLVATGVFDAKVDEPGANPQATGNYEPPAPDKNAVRIIDKDAGISYDYLGEGWKDYTWAALIENQKTVGQFITTQSLVPGGGDFIAQVTSGLLSTLFGTPDPAQYPAVLAEVEASVFSNYYPLPNEPTNQTERSLTIDGHQAYQRSTDLTWDVEGYDSTGERVVLLLIDTGRASPVLFYCSFPNTHAELYPLIDEVIASIRVDQ